MATQSRGWCDVWANAQSRMKGRLCKIEFITKGYEASELRLIGQADDVVMSVLLGGQDYPMKAAIDFEFEMD
jgi:hypothetical protein